MFKKFRMFSSLTSIHTVVSIFGIIAYPITIPLIALTGDYTTYEGINIISTLLFCVVGLVQLLFIINLLIYSSFQRKKSCFTIATMKKLILLLLLLPTLTFAQDIIGIWVKSPNDNEALDFKADGRFDIIDLNNPGTKV
jgi:hypothetical protein